MKVNLIFLSLIAIILLVILTEIILRITVGLGNPLLYIADPEIGYLIAPNQKTRRHGNLIEINQYSMRNKPINQTRDNDTFRIFLIGDSIANGGWWTDQNKTISALLEQQLSGNISNFSHLEVLNASANSWSPRHELAYLKKFGTFDAQIIILLLNTDDFFGLQPSSLVVGNDSNYPDKKPVLACQELWEKVTPNKSNKIINNKPKEKGDLVGKNLNSIIQIKAIAHQNKAQLILGITPLKREVIPPYSRDFEKKARTRLEQLATNQNIVYVDFLPIFQQQENPESLYHDHIHLSDRGTKLVSKILGETIKFTP
jgi:lysophospholipase L1-like esterase